ncbi:N-acetylmuramoyl-L-alanine amidase [Acuticoccus kandeliae]|uniref:N-acetylmuramoyl-L-alanine amidase n=1 Tax=Acuticoccus kandeliae TaxID=2073160 RepID=UPI000D3E964F|nr:N-acetylmuramoyl-L-alanine amidase [Acuticoccus kandeliae]
MITVPSPNTNERAGGIAPDIVVIHYTEMVSAKAAVDWLCNPVSKVSCHYLIGMDGDLVQMVDEDRRAWHAGISGWDGTRDINSRSIGIELDSPGHQPDAPEFPEAQLAALFALLGGIRTRWAIPKRNIVAHSDIAPARKIDPGERFPWARLAAEGHAIHVPEPAAPLAYDEAALKRALADGGYLVEEEADRFPILVRGFHRRHLPRRVETPADGLTLAAATAFAAAVAAERDAESVPLV